MFERLNKKFFNIKIQGRFDDMAEEEAYCGMFVSLQGLASRYSEVIPLTSILLWLTMTCRIAHPLIVKTSWAEKYITIDQN